MGRHAFLPCVLLVLATAGQAAGQLGTEPVGEPERPTWLLAGSSAAFVPVTGDGFVGVSNGWGAQIYIAALPGSAPVDELRLGFSVSRHADRVWDSPVHVIELYFEPLWEIHRLSGDVRLGSHVVPIQFRLGPRFTWLEEKRQGAPRGDPRGNGPQVRLRDFSYGGNVVFRAPLRERLALEAGVTLTNAVFDDPIVRAFGPDPDGVVVDWIWQFRLGMAFRIHGSNARGW